MEGFPNKLLRPPKNLVASGLLHSILIKMFLNIVIQWLIYIEYKAASNESQCQNFEILD